MEHAAGRARNGRPDEACAIYRQVLQRDPDHAEAMHRLAILAFQGGDADTALAHFERAAALCPDTAIYQYNHGCVLDAHGRTEEAADRFARAAALDPAKADAHASLGNALHRLGRHHEAALACRRTLALDPNHAGAHGTLATILTAMGDIAGALEAHGDALSRSAHVDTVLADSVFGQVWLPLTVAAGEPDPGLASAADAWIEGAKARHPESPRPWILDHVVDSVRPGRTAASHRELTGRLPSIEAETLVLSGSGAPPAPPEDFSHGLSDDLSGEFGALPATDRVAALLHFGRSGSGFLHSLIDGHDRITTLPGSYLRGFFGEGVWARIAADGEVGGGDGLADRFAALYEVLFDASHPQPVPAKAMQPGLGILEGFTNMGEDQATTLTLDRDRFTRVLDSALRGRTAIHQGDFFRMLHAAFEAARGRAGAPDTIFYHIHNPDTYEFANFLKYFPRAKLLMIVREPLDALESWICEDYETTGDYFAVAGKIVTMLGQIDQVEFRRHESVGVRLEDLKGDPDRTLGALCRWLDIEDSPSLRSPTMQGLEWWGEPGGSMHGKKDQWCPIDPAGRRGKGILSDRDRRILGALFDPFRRLYGYADDAPDRLASELRAIRPMIEEPFDFERPLFEKSPALGADPTRHGMYRVLRAVIRARWRTLDEQGTYPDLLPPLLPDPAGRNAGHGRTST